MSGARRAGRSTSWRNPFGLGRASLATQLESYARSRAVPIAVRTAIGTVLARVEHARRDDLAVVLHLAREETYRRASVEDVEDAARVAVFFADHDLRRSA